MSVASFQVSKGQIQGVGRAVCSSGDSEKEATSRLIQIVGKIQFFEVLELKSPSSGWLLA